MCSAEADKPVPQLKKIHNTYQEFAKVDFNFVFLKKNSAASFH